MIVGKKEEVNRASYNQKQKGGRGKQTRKDENGKH